MIILETTAEIWESRRAFRVGYLQTDILGFAKTWRVPVLLESSGKSVLLWSEYLGLVRARVDEDDTMNPLKYLEVDIDRKYLETPDHDLNSGLKDLLGPLFILEPHRH